MCRDAGGVGAGVVAVVVGVLLPLLLLPFIAAVVVVVDAAAVAADVAVAVASDDADVVVLVVGSLFLVTDFPRRQFKWCAMLSVHWFVKGWGAASVVGKKSCTSCRLVRLV
jgi:hypothetical protein